MGAPGPGGKPVLRRQRHGRRGADRGGRGDLHPAAGGRDRHRRRKARLAKALAAAEKERDSLSARLSNPSFVEKAKPRPSPRRGRTMAKRRPRRKD
ncbi:hypothetical protein ACFOEF_16800 [Flavobacterium palustre]|uniref:hypothetical protein n=1 Tax=Flavobacterium palustre TaxID=1476463 RepID=UPI0036131B5F